MKSIFKYFIIIAFSFYSLKGYNQIVDHYTTITDTTNFCSYTPSTTTTTRTSIISTVFEDKPGATWTSTEKKAIEYAVKLWSQKITSSKIIKVRAIRVPYSSFSTKTTVEYFHDFVSNYPIEPGKQYPQALANKLANSDLNPNSDDIVIEMPLIPYENKLWYYDTIGTPPINQYDFVTYALKAIGHGLGFVSTVRKEGASSIVYKVNGYPSIYDYYAGLTNYNSPSTALTNYVQSDQVFFTGGFAAAANNGLFPRLYSPNPFVNNKSVSCLSEWSFPAGNESALMTADISAQEVNHCISALIEGVLLDIGWGLYTSVGGETLTISGTTNLTENGNYTYNATGENLYTLNWKLVVPHANGMYIHRIGTTQAPNNTWYFNLGTLPTGYSWLRDNEGNIPAQIIIGDVNSPSAYFIVTINYVTEQPTLARVLKKCNSVTLEFYAKGVTSYIVYWDTNSGHPYANSITVSGTNSHTINNLLENKPYYYFAVKAVNATGQSAYSNQVNRYCNLIPIEGNSMNTRLQFDFDISPNPAVNQLYVNRISTHSISKIDIFDLNGRSILGFNIDCECDNASVDISSLESGFYIIKVIDKHNNSLIKKFIKQ